MLVYLRYNLHSVKCTVFIVQLNVCILLCTCSCDFHLDQALEHSLLQSRCSPLSPSQFSPKDTTADLQPQILDWLVLEHYMIGITQCALLCVQDLSLNILFVRFIAQGLISVLRLLMQMAPGLYRFPLPHFAPSQIIAPE